MQKKQKELNLWKERVWPNLWEEGIVGGSQCILKSMRATCRKKNLEEKKEKYDPMKDTGKKRRHGVSVGSATRNPT